MSLSVSTLQNLQDSQTISISSFFKLLVSTLQNLQDSQTPESYFATYNGFPPFKTYKTLKLLFRKERKCSGFPPFKTYKTLKPAAALYSPCGRFPPFKTYKTLKLYPCAAPQHGRFPPFKTYKTLKLGTSQYPVSVWFPPFKTYKTLKPQIPRFSPSFTHRQCAVSFLQLNYTHILIQNANIFALQWFPLHIFQQNDLYLITIHKLIQKQ